MHDPDWRRYPARWTGAWQPLRAGQSTMGFSGQSSRASCSGARMAQASRAVARFRHHQGLGFFVRTPLAQAQQGTLRAERASQASWKPPRPLRASRRPSRSRAGRPYHGIPYGRFRRQGLRAGPAPAGGAGAVRGQGAAGREQRVVYQPQVRPALRAGHGWAWKRRPAGRGIRPRSGGRRETGHAGGGAVVGDGTGDVCSAARSWCSW